MRSAGIVRNVTARARAPAAASLVLSLFPGIDLLGRGFEEEGFCVVRGPDLIYGGDMARFHALPGRFDGVIAGTPCQDYSRARRSQPTGDGDRARSEFRHAVTEAQPEWWLLENAPGVPELRIEGYSWLRIDLDARDFGSTQRRLRHFQYGHARGLVPIVTRRRRPAIEQSPCCMASEASRPERRTWADFCELQGLPRDFELPGMTLAARYRAVGNGVHLAVARAIAAAIRDARAPVGFRLCACDCARVVHGHRVLATAACRKRVQRRRDSAGVTRRGPVTATESPVTDQAALCAGASLSEGNSSPGSRQGRDRDPSPHSAIRFFSEHPPP
ncbi:MAG TPA: DNA cytosine methyltransferase [Burkholderiales bacterium]|nr:DNA cytosine methyltransferase [Burkholderiales bacterium]